MRRIWTISLLLCSSILAAQEYFEISTIGLDKDHDHFMPVIFGDQIVFTSNTNDDAVVQYSDRKTKKAPTSIFIANMVDGKLQGNPAHFSSSIQTNLHEGPATFSGNGTTMFFTRNLYDVKFGNDKKDRNLLGLFISELKDGEWSDPTAFVHNSTTYNVAHPTLSADGNTLIFASNMPGGNGGTDLYRCDKVFGEWSLPVNLGPEVNSKMNEFFPTLLPGNMLYFSSDRDGGAGMLDIYVTQKESAHWSNPQALPEPLNSMADDMGYAPMADQRSGYISSNRNGSDQILYFKRTIPLFVDCKPQVENNYCYEFTEEGLLPQNGLPLAYQWDLGDGNKINGAKVEHCFAGPGEYTVKLNILDTVAQKIFFNEATYELVIEDSEQPYISVEGPLNSRQEIVFNAANSKLPNKKVAEYHWNLGDSISRSGVAIEERFKKAGERTIMLDVIFAPDSTGRIQHQCVTRNIKVLEPKQLADYAEETVTIEFVDADGKVHEFTYQELPYDLFSLAINEGEDIFFTVELMNSKERISINDPFFDKAREKFEVMENYISEEAHFSYSVGNEKDLQGVHPIFQELQAMEYELSEVKAVMVEKIKDVDNAHDMAMLEKMNVDELNNTVLRMSTVYFSTGDYTIDPEFTSALDELLKVINGFDKIDLEISAHTDDVGPNSFNQILSEKRAEAIVDYLAGKGLDSDRMKSIGYGEDKPIDSNKSEEGRQANRRVEFKLVANTLLSSEL